MKRGQAPTRRTPLRAKTQLVGATPLSRAARLTRRAMARKRPQRGRGEVHARRLVTARSQGICEGCRREPATDWAHRIGRAQSGPWCPSNGLHLGPQCHRWCHDNVTEARSVGWILRSTDNPLTTPALLPAHGWVLLDADGAITPTESEAA